MHIQLRWKSRRVCRYGTYCTFAHGENELKSWMGYNKEIQEAQREEELSCQKPERSADISRERYRYRTKSAVDIEYAHSLVSVHNTYWA